MFFAQFINMKKKNRQAEFWLGYFRNCFAQRSCPEKIYKIAKNEAAVDKKSL
jgi:hypothetical protein